MITEDYVSFETAKLLKEKGFNSKCIAYYLVFNENIKFYECNNLGQSLPYISNDNWRIILRNPLELGYTAPTLQMAMKWLREVHNIAINIGWGEVLEDKFQWWCIILNQKDGSILRESEYSNTYEEASEAAIKYCLEHLI